MTSVLGAIVATLPWIAMAVVLVEFALADELPAAGVRRVFLLVGGLLLGATAAAMLVPGGVVGPDDLLVASAPVLFLAIHAGLRAVFRRLKGAEPALLFVPAAHREGGARRWFFEPGEPRSNGGWDLLYSMLVGVGMLVVLLPAMAAVVEAP